MTSFNREKENARKKLQEDVRKFLRQGGKIKKLKPGETALDFNTPKNKLTRQHRKTKDREST